MSNEIITAYTTTVNATAIEGTERVIALIEQIETLCTDLRELETAVPIKYKNDVSAVKERARAILKLIDEDTQDTEVYQAIKERSSLTNATKSKIERLGLQEQVIRLRHSGKTYKEIGEQLGVSSHLVSRFCNIYDTLSPKEQIKTRSRSIMDFVGHWEEMGALIYRMLAKLEGDPENHVKYISELRQLLKGVEQFQSRYSAQQEIQQIKDVIQEILIQELPEKRLLIMQRFREAGVNKLLPSWLARRSITQKLIREDKLFVFHIVLQATD